ncbi:MAG TPA: sialidase family protein [Burkholderiaceae bacterium]
MKTNANLALSAIALAVSAFTSVQVHAGDGPERSARMAHAQPLARHVTRHNALLAPAGDPGDDDTAVSLDPSISALCQSTIGQLNVYHPTGQNVDQINGDTIVSAGTQTGCNAAQNETTIAVNPRNPNNLVGGTNDYRIFNSREGRNDGSGWAYTTFDGGRTWRDVQLPHLTFQTGATGALSDMDSAGDPAVAFGNDGTVYYANLVFSRLNDASGIVVSASHDGGLTWGEPSIVHVDGVDGSGNPVATGIFNDKEWIAVDPRSGAVYVTWTSFQADGSPISVSRSDDGGQTWSAPAFVNPANSFTPGGLTPYSQGSIPQVGNDGTLYIAYEAAICATLNCDQPSDHDEVVVATSTDGGQTFTNAAVAVDYDFPYNPDVGRSTLTGENFRMNSYPQMAIDRATNALYVTWADDRHGRYDANGNSIRTNGDVLVVSSRDGRRWSGVQTVGSGADEFYPAIAAYGGQAAVSFYTRRYDPNGIGLDFAYAQADDGRFGGAGMTRITSQTANPQGQFVAIGAVTGTVLQGVFIGDYTAAAMGRDRVFHPSWTDFRGHPGVTSPNQDAYAQAIRLDQ